jgi:RNase P/RNase MRP subunit POP5
LIITKTKDIFASFLKRNVGGSTLLRKNISGRKRYIAIKIIGKNIFNEKDLYNAIISSILCLFGEYGASQTFFGLLEYNAKTQKAILRCSHKGLEMLIASLVTITKIKDYDAVIRILFISGTLKSLRKKMAYR